VDLLSSQHLDDIYAWLRSRELLQKLEAGKDAAYHSRHGSLVLDVPLDVDLEDCKPKGFVLFWNHSRKVRVQIFLGKITELQQRFGGVTEEDSSQAESSKTALLSQTRSPPQILEPEFNSDDLGFQCCRYRSHPAANLSPITPALLTQAPN